MTFLNKICQTAVLASIVVSSIVWAEVTIYMCGDSTMQDWNEGYYPKQGQGQDFHFWFDKAKVVNRGQGGMSLGGGGKD